MNNTQLPLIAALASVPLDNAPVRRRRTALALTVKHHRVALQCLLQGPAPLDQIARLTGEADTEKLALELRELGLDIPTVIIPAPSRDGQTANITVCSLTKHDVRKIQQYIKKQESENA